MSFGPVGTVEDVEEPVDDELTVALVLFAFVAPQPATTNATTEPSKHARHRLDITSTMTLGEASQFRPMAGIERDVLSYRVDTWNSPRIVEGSVYAACRVWVLSFSYSIGARQPQ